MIVGILYYVQILLYSYRISDNIMKLAIALIIHPLLSEFILTLLKSNKGLPEADFSAVTAPHPFYEHLDAFPSGKVYMYIYFIKKILFLDG